MNRVRIVMHHNGWVWPSCNPIILGAKSPEVMFLFPTWNLAYQRHHSQQLKTMVSGSSHLNYIKTENLQQFCVCFMIIVE